MLSAARSPCLNAWKIKRFHTPWLINTTAANFKTGFSVLGLYFQVTKQRTELMGFCNCQRAIQVKTQGWPLACTVPMHEYQLRTRNLRAVAYFLLTKESVTIKRSGNRLGVGEPIQVHVIISRL